MSEKLRCGWCLGSDAYKAYHDTEWGRPQHDDRVLFEFLILEGAQAGLSWSTILGKRDGYRRVFAGFDPAVLARWSDAKLEKALLDPGIVRNRLKVWSVRTNARAFLEVQREFGSFERYLWAWVEGKPVLNAWDGLREVPARTDLSDRISKDLLKRGFKFVGSTIVYAYLQAMGVVNDHIRSCHRYPRSGRS
ncbi:MAG: DNA-3-methyladenine glycosylase [Panacagrimonas sp.]|jgi:DNA-3-methyladenine glycosylase I|nr:DNA-3-methyladenine glycosylase I [Panacagrimonas sp.]MCC2655752.1 DNA-3-methyladenine glycosylase [Panacagrimonas sp.]